MNFRIDVSQRPFPGIRQISFKYAKIANFLDTTHRILKMSKYIRQTDFVTECVHVTHKESIPWLSFPENSSSTPKISILNHPREKTFGCEYYAFRLTCLHFLIWNQNITWWIKETLIFLDRLRRIIIIYNFKKWCAWNMIHHNT